MVNAKNDNFELNLNFHSFIELAKLIEKDICEDYEERNIYKAFEYWQESYCAGNRDKEDLECLSEINEVDFA